MVTVLWAVSMERIDLVGVCALGFVTGTDCAGW
jgi:hypothetical protein